MKKKFTGIRNLLRVLINQLSSVTFCNKKDNFRQPEINISRNIYTGYWCHIVSLHFTPVTVLEKQRLFNPHSKAVLSVYYTTEIN